MNTNRIIYWVSTGLMCLFFFMGAMRYFFTYDQIHEGFTNLGFPVWLIYPMAVLKILGAVAILAKYSQFLKDLAYAGFFYNSVLALAAHAMIADGQYAASTIALVLVIVSWVFDRRVYGTPAVPQPAV